LPTVVAHCHRPSSHQFTPSLVFNACEALPHSGPGWVSPPHVGLSPLCPAHLAMSPALCVLLTSLGPSRVSPVHTHLVSLHVCLSPVHLAHLPISPPLCILLTLLGPGGSLPMCMPLTCVSFPTSQCLLPAHPAHLVRSSGSLPMPSEGRKKHSKCLMIYIYI